MKQSNPPMISIIVPIYNAACYLRQSLDSILAQTHPDFELILVNDGSTDKSAEYCSEYAAKDNRIRLITVNRGGVSHARNVGMEQACGEWIYFMDADDYLNPGHLKNYAENMEADLVFQGYRMFDATTDATITLKEQPYMEALCREESMRIVGRLWEYGNFFGPTWNKIFRRSIIQKYHLRFHEDISIREDELFTFEYCQYIHTVKVLPTVSYNYRKTPNSLMRSAHTPEEILHVATLSRQAALQLPLYDAFKTSIEKSYTQSLCWAFGLTYGRRGVLPCRAFRLSLITLLQERNESYPTRRSRQLLCKTAALTDAYHCAMYWSKRTAAKILFIK